MIKIGTSDFTTNSVFHVTKSLTITRSGDHTIHCTDFDIVYRINDLTINGTFNIAVLSQLNGYTFIGGNLSLTLVDGRALSAPKRGIILFNGSSTSSIKYSGTPSHILYTETGRKLYILIWSFIIGFPF